MLKRHVSPGEKTGLAQRVSGPMGLLPRRLTDCRSCVPRHDGPCCQWGLLSAGRDGLVAQSHQTAGFTLLELLVVLGVMALLAALILPAVGKAREAARRARCLNHLKQLGLAMHQYHEVHRSLPPGTIGRYSDVRRALDEVLSAGAAFDPSRATPETPWVVLLYPYLEQENVRREYDADVGVFGYVDLRPPYLVAGLNANARVLAAWVPALQCPSDARRPFYYDVNALLGQPLGVPIAVCSRGNYAVNWGNTNFAQDADLDEDGQNDPDVVARPAPFGRNRGAAFRTFRRGIDQTVLVSEVIQGTERDLRGSFWVPFPGGGHYLSRLGPNGAFNAYGGLRDARRHPDAVPFSGFCHSENSAPCVTAPAPPSAYAAARSHHPGGVNVLFAGGRAEFVSNAVDRAVWLDLHSLTCSE